MSNHHHHETQQQSRHGIDLCLGGRSQNVCYGYGDLGRLCCDVIADVQYQIIIKKYCNDVSSDGSFLVVCGRAYLYLDQRSTSVTSAANPGNLSERHFLARARRT